MHGLLLCRNGQDAGLAHRVTGECIIVGRAQDCAVQVMDDALSRHHARLVQGPEGPCIEDLGSSLGTEVNGEAIAQGQRMPLANFDVILLGQAIELVWIELARVPQSEVLAASIIGPGGERVPLRVGENVIGSHEDCDLIVPDPTVAPRHAVLALSARGLSVRAIDAAALKVNGEDVRASDLASGDVLDLSPTAEFHVETFCGLAPPLPAEPALAEPAAAEPQRPDLAPDTMEDTAAVPLQAPPDPRETAALPIAEIEETLRQARARQAKLAEQASLEETDTGRVAILHAATLDLGTSVKRPKSDAASGDGAKDLRALRREVAYRIIVKTAAGEPRVTLLREGRHLLGRSQTCRVIVSHPTVSREHAEIHVGPEGLRVRDLGSSNGTFRDKQRVTEVVLKPGETIRFGEAHATFEEI